ncbi:hypothetical protein GEMRC1_002136 [Eukaryota sp. GEM-RC1]
MPTHLLDTDSRCDDSPVNSPGDPDRYLSPLLSNSSTPMTDSPLIRSVLRQHFDRFQSISRSASPLKHLSVLASPTLLTESHRHVKLKPSNTIRSDSFSGGSDTDSVADFSQTTPAVLDSPAFSTPSSLLNRSAISPTNSLSSYSSPKDRFKAAVMRAVAHHRSTTPQPKQSPSPSPQRSDGWNSVYNFVQARSALRKGETPDMEVNYVRAVDSELTRMRDLAKMPKAGTLSSSCSLEFSGLYDRMSSNRLLLSKLNVSNVSDRNLTFLEQIYEQVITPRVTRHAATSSAATSLKINEGNSAVTNTSWNPVNPLKKLLNSKSKGGLTTQNDQNFLDLELKRLEVKSQYDAAFNGAFSLSVSDVLTPTSDCQVFNNDPEELKSLLPMGWLYLARVNTATKVNLRFAKKFLSCGELEFYQILLFESYVFTRLLLTSLDVSHPDDEPHSLCPPAGYVYSDPFLDLLTSSPEQWSKDLFKQLYLAWDGFGDQLLSSIPTDQINHADDTSQTAVKSALISKIESLFVSLLPSTIPKLKNMPKLLLLKCQYCCLVSKNLLEIGHSLCEAFNFVLNDLLLISHFCTLIFKNKLCLLSKNV